MANRNINIDLHDGQPSRPSRPPLSPQEISQRRMAGLGADVITWTLGIAAVLLAIVAFSYTALFTLGLAETWGDVLRMIALAAVYTLVVSGLPTGAAFMQRAYPQEARMAMNVWYGAVAMSAIGITAYALGSASPASPAPSRSAAEIRNELEYLQPADWRLWSTTDRCREPGTAQKRACDTLLARRAALTAELHQLESPLRKISFLPRDWLPNINNASALASATGQGEGFWRGLLVLLLSVSASAGSGLLGRWTVISAGESHRLAYGEAGPAPVARPQPVEAMETHALVGQGDVFSAWAEHRLRSRPGGKVQGDVAYRDYEETCQLNGVEPMSAKKFGDMLTQLAAMSQGRYTKAKLGGKIFYQGWELPEESRVIEYAPVERLESHS